MKPKPICRSPTPEQKSSRCPRDSQLTGKIQPSAADTINGFGLLVGGFLIVYFGLQAVGGDGIFSALNTMQE
ncbi:hypothetical protein AB1L30_00635, partial [Bremerella sp. JC817]|uniref:hypothetical protein n=1 Tax=Bremerella sp. JC817 TaxID=3231756 RepID=UPI003457D257